MTTTPMTQSPAEAARDAAARALAADERVKAIQASKEVARRDAERANRDAAIASAHELRWRKKSAADVSAAVKALHVALSTVATEAPTDRPSPSTRAGARQFLMSGSTEALELVTARDQTVASIRDLQMTAGRVIGEAPDNKSGDLADELECECWSALLTRLRFLAGERP